MRIGQHILFSHGCVAPGRLCTGPAKKNKSKRTKMKIEGGKKVTGE